MFLNKTMFAMLTILGTLAVTNTAVKAFSVNTSDLVFNNLDPQDIFIPSPLNLDRYDYIFKIKNNTSKTFTDFHLEILGTNQVTFQKPVSSDTFNNYSQTGTRKLNFFGGSGINNKSGSNEGTVTFNITYFDGMTKIRATPSVPEPLTILGSLTALGMGTVLKKHYSKKLEKQTV